MRFLFYWSAPSRDLPSFPTRRSSDLAVTSRWLTPETRADLASSVPAHCSAMPAPQEPPGALSKENIEKVAMRLILRSEEHTSELQSRFELVCRLLLEKKKSSTTTSAT